MPSDTPPPPVKFPIPTDAVVITPMELADFNFTEGDEGKLLAYREDGKGWYWKDNRPYRPTDVRGALRTLPLAKPPDEEKSDEPTDLPR